MRIKWSLPLLVVHSAGQPPGQGGGVVPPPLPARTVTHGLLVRDSRFHQIHELLLQILAICNTIVFQNEQ